MSWYNTGYDVVNKQEARVVGGDPRRLWIPAGKSNDIVFVDEAPFTISEHNCKINGNWKNWFTCVRGVHDEAACCEILGNRSAYTVGYYTVVTCNEWTDKKGNKHQFEMEFFPAKFKTLKKMKRKCEEKGGLIGQMWKTTREDEKSPGVGDEFEFVRPVDMNKLFNVAMFNGKKLTELWDKAEANAEVMEQLKKVFQLQFDGEGKLLRKIVPFNYFELLQPKENKEIRMLLKGVEVEDKDDGFSGGGAKKSGADEDVPF